MTHEIVTHSGTIPGDAAERATNGGKLTDAVFDGEPARRRLRVGRPPEVLAQADLAIHPDTGGVGFLEWHQIDVAREAGRIATREALPRIMELVRVGGVCG